MKFIYTNHAQNNLKERKIRKDVIEETILNPNEFLESSKGRKIAHKIINNKLLRVVYKTSKKAYIVITFYYARRGRY